MSEKRPLIAQSNWELLQTRDPHGAQHKYKTFKNISNDNLGDEKGFSFEATRQDQRPLQSWHDIEQYLHKHTPVVPMPPKSTKRRVLPPTPGTPMHHERHAAATVPLSSTKAVYRDPELNAADERERTAKGAPKTIQPLGSLQQCPYFCTNTGPTTQLQCVNCGHVYCGQCLHGDKGLMFYRDPVTTYLKLRCAVCKKHPKTCAIADRPPWMHTNGGANAVFGDAIQPAFGRVARHYQNEQQFKDRHLLQSLRIPEDPNIQWRTDKIRSKIMLEDGMDEGDVPDVFIRLLDPGRYTGAHKARFSKQGNAWVGNGIDGRREDTQLQDAIAGRSSITRTLEPELDTPIRLEVGAIPEWELKQLDRNVHYTRDINKEHHSSDVDHMDGVLARLAAEKDRRHSVTDGEYEKMQKVRKDFGLDPRQKRAWQTENMVAPPAAFASMAPPAAFA